MGLILILFIFMYTMAPYISGDMQRSQAVNDIYSYCFSVSLLPNSCMQGSILSFVQLTIS